MIALIGILGLIGVLLVGVMVGGVFTERPGKHLPTLVCEAVTCEEEPLVPGDRPVW